MSNNLDITPQMALAAARVLRDYCRNNEYVLDINCNGCSIKSLCENDFPDSSPCVWDIPERDDDE